MHGRLKSAQPRDTESLNALKHKALQVCCCSIVSGSGEGGSDSVCFRLGGTSNAVLFLSSVRFMVLWDQTLTLIFFVSHVMICTDGIEKPKPARNFDYNIDPNSVWSFLPTTLSMSFSVVVYISIKDMMLVAP